ncbi:OmpA/MotB domain-containing protein [Alcanivorax hongdengensis A-11-3]|uniref:OmpA/MotB domain-containing protein n=1 Tax=Alcanivorax hongdengensis A-11-3 TaxID=1177179 RepID=L0WA65_9GAMM|nr:OmpA family protein [Alcanivorax hongdengensis]EKF73861.1 OmpA/MotB domain-containing protein [Alcanivorax hongdengensis A-11-3]
MIKRIPSALALMALAGSANALQPAALFNHETVMEQTYQSRADTVLQSAPLRYLDSEKRQGYASGGEVQVVGRMRRSVLDHPPADSDLSIIDHYRARLTGAGYRITFECHRANCGDAAGWRLMMGKGVIGQNDTQHYLLAHKGKRADRGDYVSVYVNEVDDLPRSVAVSMENAHLTGVHSLAAEPGEQQLFFGLNDSRLTLADLLRVDRVATALREQDDLRAGVIGYADGTGDEVRESNQDLAQERADRVAAWLSEHGGAGWVANHGGQVQVPPPGEKGRRWRRVDLVLEIHEAEKEALDTQADAAPAPSGAEPASTDEGNNLSQGDQDDETDPV